MNTEEQEVSDPLRQYAKDQVRQVCKNLGHLCREAGVRQEDVAERIGYNQPNLSRLFAGRYSPRGEVIFYVLNAINEIKGTSYSLKDVDVKPEQLEGQ